MLMCTMEQESAFEYDGCVCVYMPPWEDIPFMQLHKYVG